MRFPWLPALVSLSLLGFAHAGSNPAPLDESAPAVPVTFTVLSRTGGFIDVAGLAYWPAEDTATAVLAVHGAFGLKENNWGPLSVPGYSLGHDTGARGRALVAIDLPGYGGSGGVDQVAGIEDHAFVLNQIAAQLRAGAYSAQGEPPRAFDAIAALGHSYGSYVIIVGQGLFASFDAIVPAGASLNGVREDAGPCPFEAAGGIPTGTCPEDTREIWFYLPNTDEAIIPEVLAGEELPKASFANLLVWALTPAHEVSRTIDVPVLVANGAEDFLFGAGQTDGEEAHYPASDDVSVVEFADAGHYLFHHLNAAGLRAELDAWLDERGL